MTLGKMRIELDRSVVDCADTGRATAATSIRALIAHHAIDAMRVTRIPCATSAHRRAVVENTASPITSVGKLPHQLLRRMPPYRELPQKCQGKSPQELPWRMALLG